MHLNEVKSMCLIKHHSIKVYETVEVQLHIFLTLVLLQEVSGQLHTLAIWPLGRAFIIYWLGG
jgi:hypothetical protein